MQRLPALRNLSNGTQPLLFSRRLASIDEARRRILGHAENTGIRTGAKFFRQHLKGDAINRWQEPSVREILRPLKWAYATPEEEYRAEKVKDLKARGKPPTKKGEGKRKNRKK